MPLSATDTIGPAYPVSLSSPEVGVGESLGDIGSVARNLVTGYGVSPDKAILLAHSLLESKATMEGRDITLAEAKLDKLLGIARGFIDVGCPLSEALSLAGKMVDAAESSVTRGAADIGELAERGNRVTEGLLKRLYAISEKSKESNINITEIPDNTEVVNVGESAQILVMRILEEHRLRAQDGNNHPIVVVMGGESSVGKSTVIRNLENVLSLTQLKLTVVSGEGFYGNVGDQDSSCPVDWDDRSRVVDGNVMSVVGKLISSERGDTGVARKVGKQDGGNLYTIKEEMVNIGDVVVLDFPPYVLKPDILNGIQDVAVKANGGRKSANSISENEPKRPAGCMFVNIACGELTNGGKDIRCLPEGQLARRLIRDLNYGRIPDDDLSKADTMNLFATCVSVFSQGAENVKDYYENAESQDNFTVVLNPHDPKQVSVNHPAKAYRRMIQAESRVSKADELQYLTNLQDQFNCDAYTIGLWGDTYYLQIKGGSDHGSDDIAIPFQSIGKDKEIIPASGEEVYAVLETIRNPGKEFIGDTVDKFKSK